MKFVNTFVLAALMGTALTAFADNGTTTTTTTTSNDQSQQSSMMNKTAEGMTTQMTQDDKTMLEAVQKVLQDGGYAGVTATVSAGSVTLKGTVMEDKLQAMVDAVSKVDKVNAVNIDGVITSKMVPPAPAQHAPMETPPAATGK